MYISDKIDKKEFSSNLPVITQSSHREKDRS